MSIRCAPWVVGLLCALTLAATARAVVDAVPEARDLSAAGPLAAQPELPLLLVFTADDCTFCERLEEEVLVPMLRSGDYDRRLIIRAVNLSGSSLIGFDGVRVDPWEVARRYDVKVTPTMVVVDHTGVPLADPMVGLGPVDYVESRIVAALRHAHRDDGAAPSAPVLGVTR